MQQRPTPLYLTMTMIEETMNFIVRKCYRTMVAAGMSEHQHSVGHGSLTASAAFTSVTFTVTAMSVTGAERVRLNYQRTTVRHCSFIEDDIVRRSYWEKKKENCFRVVLSLAPSTQKCAATTLRSWSWKWKTRDSRHLTFVGSNFDLVGHTAGRALEFSSR